MKDMAKFQIFVEEINTTLYEFNVDNEDEARKNLWDLIDAEGLDDHKTTYGDIVIVSVKEVTNNQLPQRPGTLQRKDD